MLDFATVHHSRLKRVLRYYGTMDLRLSDFAILGLLVHVFRLVGGKSLAPYSDLNSFGFVVSGI